MSIEDEPTTDAVAGASTESSKAAADVEAAVEAETAVELKAKPGLFTRGRLFIDTSKSRAVDTVERLESQRGGNRIIDAAFGSVETDTQTGGDLLAGAVAFRYFLLFVPFVFVKFRRAP